jgi:hypothetical protein
MKHFKGFIELYAKLDADRLLGFVILHRQNETESQKTTRVKAMRFHNSVSLGKLMQ